MESKPKKHIVIVYENTGGGHKKLAAILASYLDCKNIVITLTTMSDLAYGKDSMFVHHWNWLIKKNYLRLADWWLNFFSRIILLPFYYSLYANIFSKNLARLKPDLVISTADVNRLLGSYCYDQNIPFFVFITSGAIFIDILSPSANHVVYFKETAEIINHVHQTSYFKQHITPDSSWLTRVQDVTRLLMRYTFGYYKTPYFLRYQDQLCTNNSLPVTVLGPIREAAFYQPADVDTIKNQYQIPNTGYNILISNGSLGGKMIIDIILQLNKVKNIHLNLITICGHDEKLYCQLQSLKTAAHIKVIPIQKQESIALLYKMADISIGRGTAGILMDSIASLTPLLVLDNVTTNDYGTLDIIKKYGIGLIAASIHELPILLESILIDFKSYLNAHQKLTEQYGNVDANIIKTRLQNIILPHLAS